MALIIKPKGIVTPTTGHKFQGKTLADVAEIVGLLPEAAMVKWNITYDPPVMVNNKIKKIVIRLKLTMRMPTWLNYAKRPMAEKKEWDRFYKALRYHEDQHIKICKRETEKMHKKLLKIKDFDKFEKKFNFERNEVQKKNDEFDFKVERGIKQNSPYGNTVIKLP